jgi:hypothetical protein
MCRIPRVRCCGVVLVIVSATAKGQSQSIFHDPWLNWDFINLTGQVANDFEIIVESGTFSPNQVLLGMPFPAFGVTHADYDGDGNNETLMTWSGANVAANQIAHIGAYIQGSGKILGAQWTLNGQPIGLPLAISYELTEIRPTNSAEIHMQLKMPQSFFDSHPEEQAGWVGIRTFRNIPASLLDLGDLNRSLDLTTLAAYEVTPKDGVTHLPITGPILMSTDSFFDVYLDTVSGEFLGPQYESLLYAEVLNAGAPIGMFWNLNPQSPEPGSLLMLAFGGLILMRRKR